MKWFKDIKTLEDLKKCYHKLIFKFHPDRGGSTASMQEINLEYEELFAKLKNFHADKDGNVYEKETNEEPEEFMELLEELMKLSGITIECIGSFVWVGGETKLHKDKLKEIGLKFSSKKSMWYFAPEWWVKRGKKQYSMDEIRGKYGVQYKATTDKTMYLKHCMKHA